MSSRHSAGEAAVKSAPRGRVPQRWRGVKVSEGSGGRGTRKCNCDSCWPAGEVCEEISSQNPAAVCASVISTFFLKQSPRAVQGILSPW